MKDLGISAKLAVIVGLFVAGFVAFGVASYTALSRVKVNGPIYGRIVQGKDLIADVLPPPEYIIEAYLVALQITDAVESRADHAELETLIEKGRGLRQQYEQRHWFWVHVLPDAPLKDAMVVQSYKPAQDFFEIRDREFIPAVLEGDSNRARGLVSGRLRESYEAHRTAIERVVSLATERNYRDEQRAGTVIKWYTVLLACFGMVVVGAVTALSGLLARGIVRPLRQTMTALEALAAGDFTARIGISSGDEMGRMGMAFNRAMEERRRVDEQLRRLSRAVEQSPSIVLITDTAGNIEYVNPRFTAVTGYSPDEVFRRNPRLLKSGDTPAEEYARLWRTVTAGHEWRGELRNRKKNGESYWAAACISPIRDAQGKITHFLSMQEDITERKRAERRLAVQYAVTSVLSEATSLEDAAPKILQAVCEAGEWNVGVMWEVDRHAQELRCVDLWCAPDARSESFAAMTREITFAPGVCLPGRVLAGGMPAAIPDVASDSNFQRREAATRDGLHGAFAFPIRFGGTVTGVVEFFSRDARHPDEYLARMVDAMGSQLGQFIERQRAEAARRESDERTRLIVERALDAVITMDTESRITGWNPQAEATFGWGREEALGQHVSIIMPPRYHEAHLQGVQHYLISGEGPLLNRRTEITAVHRDGHEFPVEVAVTRVHSAGTVMFSAFLRDISERKQAEAALRAARDAAEAATRAKSEFLANMSHEIRTPMNAVIGMTGLLLDTPLTAEQHEFVETIRTGSDALLGIINDILDFSKIESGQLELDSQAFDLRDCVEQALDLVTPKAAEKGLDLAYFVDHRTPHSIVGDVTRLRQVLVNLLSNAVKFTTEGEVVVSVEARALDDRRHEVHIAVEDTGIGIPPERMDRLFKSFSQVDASTTRQYGGSGLGLAISRRLSELMGGRMWVESEAGKGSVFHFTIVAAAAPSQPRTYLRGTEPELAGRRLLIVDDNATNRHILTLQAQSWGMLARAASSGPEALAWVRRGDPFDIAILDMLMPEMDGVMLAGELRALHDTRDIPLILLTSSLARRNGDGVLFAAVLTKPIKPSQLFDALMRVIAARPRGAGATAAAASPSIDRSLATHHPLRILLVEDNAINQKVTLRLLDRMGYRADVAGNGVEGIAAVSRQPYDVVLMDVQMPEMDGLEAARRICKGWPRERRPRLVAMTANAMQGDREACLEAGMDDYISKPVKIDELQAALTRCTRIVAAASETPPAGAEAAG